ncbi:MAG: NADH-quinone oxidoreductase subunit [Chloroflexota bacterium]|jgi:NADH:ubiquinone oxidoreductase subunit K|nr:NADH-quinone oxidoreductase subunit [Chloroflexota bacterium]
MPPAAPPLYPITLQHGLILGALLFAIGIVGALTKRNAIAILMSIELMLNGVIVTFVAFARHAIPSDLTGQVFGIFIMTVAAAEAAVGLAIVIAVHRVRRTVEVDAIDTLQG